MSSKVYHDLTWRGRNNYNTNSHLPTHRSSNRVKASNLGRKQKVLSMIELFNRANLEEQKNKPFNKSISKASKPVIPPKPVLNKEIDNKKEDLNKTLKVKSNVGIIPKKNVVNYWKQKDFAFKQTVKNSCKDEKKLVASLSHPIINKINVENGADAVETVPNRTESNEKNISKKALMPSKTVKKQISKFESLTKTITPPNELSNEVGQNINQSKTSKSTKINPIPKPRRLFTADNNQCENNGNWKNQPTSKTSPKTDFSNGSYFKKSLSDLTIDGPLYDEVEENNNLLENVIQTNQITPSWKRQHNYEEVDDIFYSNKSSPAKHEYDHLFREDKRKRIPRSFSDSTDDYAQLQLHESTDETRSNQSIYAEFDYYDKDNTDNTNSHMVEIIRNTFSANCNGGTRKPNSENLSSSSNDDSDNEIDITRHRQTLDRVRTLQKNYRQTLKYKSLERELLQDDYSHTKIFYQVIVATIGDDRIPKISYKFQPEGKNIGDEVAIARFCFPDALEIQPCLRMPSQNYSFMLTQENGSRQFGYCLRILPPCQNPRYPVVYCLISALGSFALYHTILLELEQRHIVSVQMAEDFLKALYKEKIPMPGTNVHIRFKDSEGKMNMVLLRRPLDVRLEHVDLQCLFNQMGIENTIKVFVSLLLERRIILCGKSLNSLTACVHALRSILYPFVWQHVFIPVLPPQMLDLCCIPTPLLIGILHSSLDKLKTLPLEEVIIVDLYKKEVIQEAGDELSIIPKKLQASLIKLLETYVNSPTTNKNVVPKFDYATDLKSAERNTFIGESILYLFVKILGHYREHCKPVPTNFIQPTRGGQLYRIFDKQSFYNAVSSRSIKRFLDIFMETQMFDGFIHSRETSRPQYQDLFEKRIEENALLTEDSKINVLKSKVKKLVQTAMGPKSKLA